MGKKTAKPSKKKAASPRSKAVTGKKVAKKSPAKKAPSKKAPSKKAPAKKPASKKAPAKTTKKPAPKKKAPATKKTTKKTATTKKPAAKKAPAKKPAKKAPKSKATTKKPVAKKTGGPSAAKKPVAKKKAPTPPERAQTSKNSTSDKNEPGARKGITVVSKKSPRRPRTPPAGSFMMPSSGMAGFGAALGKPLIPSGPSAQSEEELAAAEADKSKKKKTPFTKRELTKFRKILEEKRQELSGEVSELENEALGRGGSEQRTKSQAVDDQGSEAADQAIGLDLVAAERRLLSEIIEAIQRIDDGVYGICELTGKSINKERLEELPWTRYSIDAARQLERRSLGT